MRNQSTLSLSEICQKFSAAGLFIKDSSGGLSGECPCLENHPTRAGRKSPNFSIKLGSNGEVLTHCFAGCAQDVVFKKTLEVLGDGGGSKTPKAPSWKPIVVEQKIERPDPEKDFSEDWETLHDLPNGSDDHDYLKRKNAKSYGLKKDENGNLVVPIYFYEQEEEPSLIGLQLIDKEGAKKTARKSKMKGGAYLLDTPQDNYPIYLCEGYATAATVAEATFGSAGTCFGITQMLNSARVLQRAYPKSEVICLPDAGVKQETIEELIKEGFRVIQPDFSTYRPQEGEKVPTDYNDLARLASVSEKGSDIIKGHDAVVRQLDAALKKPKPKSQAETVLAPFLEPYSWEQFLHDLTHTPESIDSGFMLKGKPLLYPSGAISIIAGATNHGKTAVLIQSLVNYLQNEKYKDKTALFLTLEESAKAVNVKILVNMLGGLEDIKVLDYPRVHLMQAITEGRTIPDLDSHRETLSRLRLVPKFERVGDIIAGINEAIRTTEGSIGAVFIDYAQLLRGNDGERTRQEELKGICISMKDLAVETGLPFIIGAQFNRSVQSPLDLHSTNLGEAGDLERIASLLVGIWNGDKKAKADKADLNTLKNEPYKIGVDGTRMTEMYFEILKNREGESGTNDWLRWRGSTGRISNEKGEEGKSQKRPHFVTNNG